MRTIDLLGLSSPEWSATEEGLWTSQYGASIQFQSQTAGTLSLRFAKHYPESIWTLTVDGVDQEELIVPEQVLDLHLQADHQYQLTLNQWQSGQVAFWQGGLVIEDGAWSGDQNLQPIIDWQSSDYLTFVGDSIVAGEAMAGVNHDQHQPTQSFPSLVAKQLQLPLNRIAYGGTGLTNRAPFQEPRAIDALWQVGDGIARRRVHSSKVVVAYGINDANYGATDQEFAFGLRVYLLELVKRFHEAHFYLLTPWNGAFAAIVAAEVARFTSFTVVPAHEWGIQTRPYHPDGLAHQKIAAELVKILED
ncbi:hypothetical protein FPFC_021370 [Fructobacillus pseudoficulneus]|uniref:SGNH hydrolase-type esterase domain-containing protein n=1 Tax=Fructobacillus pseudoficulneus TaxID=220714 RepID=A0A3F3H7H4_9LACO|nr:hypothetical protein [Fructobacillus pseudoficulneus]GAP02689.1 hypothetical protein FPFC_021370 [Fructobacillus pseudoficulneus]SEH39113.1 GDSL-like Lipase/Acylhydrolase family protein [Fructobacillus pseudoficulneus]